MAINFKQVAFFIYLQLGYNMRQLKVKGAENDIIEGPLPTCASGLNTVS